MSLFLIVGQKWNYFGKLGQEKKSVFRRKLKEIRTLEKKIQIESFFSFYFVILIYLEFDIKCSQKIQY